MAGTGAQAVVTMQQNLFVGFNIDALIEALLAGTEQQQLDALLRSRTELLRTDFPARASQIADEIARTRPHAVALQELSEITLIVPGLISYDMDFKAELLDALSDRGLDYDLYEIENINIDVGAALGVTAALIDRDGLLVRGDLAVADDGGDTYALCLGTGLPTCIGGLPFPIQRGYVWADVAVNGDQASNVLGLTRPVPPCFWSASTGIEPVDTTIGRVLATAYCHHIERLMVLGNIMLLAEFHPDRVHDWYSELFIDAYDWVMVPNVYGMSQFSDGGLMSSKPYISGSRYLLKMSDYPEGPWCDLWDALYWRFLYVHRDIFEHNVRMAPFMTYITRMPEEKRAPLIAQAEHYLTSMGACSGVPASPPGEGKLKKRRILGISFLVVRNYPRA